MRKPLFHSVLVLVSNLMACSADPTEVVESGDQAYSCGTQQAVSSLEAAGFVREKAVGREKITGGTQAGGYHYETAEDAYRYVHADGRIQYAECFGVVGPRFPIKDVVFDIKGRWHYKRRLGPQSPWREQSSSSASLKLTTRDFVSQAFGGAHLVLADIELPTQFFEPVLRTGPCYQKRCDRYVQQPLWLKQSAVQWHEHLGLSSDTVEMRINATVRLAWPNGKPPQIPTPAANVTIDIAPTGTVQSVTATMGKGDELWEFTL